MKTMLRLIFMLILYPATAAAQPDMIVEHYTKDNGLPSNTVYCAHKDGDGFVWFGTWHGLCSFDGAEFTPFITRISHKSDMPPRKVRNIIGDKDGYLWIRNTDNHLYLFNKYAETYRDVYNELKKQARNVQVIKIQAMDNGRILLLTRSKDIFEAYVGDGGNIVVRKIFDARRHTDPATMKLKTNILGENGRYVYWLSKSLTVNTVTKKNGRRLLGRLNKDRRFTCFKKKGQYICAGTASGGIYIINADNGKTEYYRFKGMGSPVSSINIMNGRVFFTTPSGLYSFAKGSAPSLITQQAADITQSFTDKYNKLWLCSERGVLICHDPKTSTSQTFTMPADSLFAEMKFRDTGANGLFILMRNGEVWRYNHQTRMMQNINRQKEFSNYIAEPHFFDIDIDPNGILWLSSTSSGVYKVCFPHYNFRFMFPGMLISSGESDNNGIRAVYQARNGDLWIGTRKGELFCMDFRTHNIKRRFGSGEIGPVYHIMEDNQGNYWFSTKGAGLIKATPDAMAPQGLRITRYTNRRGDRNSLSSNRVYFTYQDSRGRIWVCTFYGGLNLIEERGGKTIFRNRHNGFGTYPRYDLYTDVRSITEDRNGRMWVGTTDGLMSFDGKFNRPSDIKFETYRDSHRSGAMANDIFTMYKDHKGYIWMGIFGSGLSKIEYYDEKSRQPVLKTYMINEKQGGDVISSIVEDKSHCLWVCTENGLASMRPGSSFLKSYDRFAGFPEVNIEDNTSICLQNGNILIGCRQGLLSFNPETVRNDNDSRYTTFITGFKVVNRELWDFNPPIFEGSLKYADKIVLSHDQSTFTIEFAAPYYADNTMIPYTYILDGYEEQWHNNGSNRIASYANVPPGHYKFRVKVNDNNSPERVIEIIITPPWWATWWAYTIYTLLALLAVYGALRLVMYMIRMRNEVYINDRLAELKIRFFTNVSHELRTPLTLIKGPVEELKNNEKLSPAGKEYVSLIDRNARKMLQLVNQILDFRKIQNGKMKMHVSYVDLNAMIEQLMQEFRVLAEERDIAFVFDKAEEHVTAWCDAEKIAIVLNNLLSNAFKYTGEGGRICIALEHDYDRQICTMRVEDDGVGIPKSQLEVIFERFSQASNKTSDDNAYAGTGIGLSLSREYVNMHHGRIWAENIDGGKGVVFSVELPTGRDNFNGKDIEVYFDDSTAENRTADEGDNGEEDTMTQKQEDATRDDLPTIMLIEDNIDMCRMLQLQLRSNSYNVLTAHDGEEGLKKIYQHHPDIIITDLMMPGMDGMQLLRAVRQDFNISHIPVIVLTAKNTEEDKLTSVRSGANAFIAKPFSSSYLMARINQLLEEQRIFQRKMVVQTTVENTAEADGDSYEQHLVKKDIEFVHKIHDIIEKNLNSNDFNIDTIAGTIGLSRSAFFKKLKSLTGFAPVDLVKEIRLNKAARLIETTDDSITEIAYSVGFRDAGYFGKCFRKKYDMTPKEYRAEKRRTQQQ